MKPLLDGAMELPLDQYRIRIDQLEEEKARDKEAMIRMEEEKAREQDARIRAEDKTARVESEKDRIEAENQKLREKIRSLENKE